MPALTEAQFNAVKDAVLASAPNGLSETDFNRWVGPAMAQALGEAENGQMPSAGSGTSRFLSGAWKNLNPITAVEGVATAVRHPLDTTQSILMSNLAELRKAAEDAKAGRYSEMVGHGAAGVLPIIGPAAAAAGERIGSGDVAGGLGETSGLLAPFGVGPAVRGAGAVTRGAVGVARALPAGADTLDRLATLADDASTNRIVDVAAPKVGPNKLRLNNRMAEIAPQIARDADLGALSRQGLQRAVEGKLEAATAALDDAADTRLVSQQVPTQPLVAALDAKIAELTATPVEGSTVPRTAQPVPSPTRAQQVAGITGELTDAQAYKAEPIGRVVEPAPSTAQISTLRQIRNEIAQLGSVAPYEAVRRIRGAWDQVAKVKYLPSSATDALKSQGEATAAMKGTGAIRDALAAVDPTTAAANAQYSLYKTASDILQATEETERARPRVLRGVLARTTGAVAGAEASGAGGAIVGALLGSVVERAAELAPTTKLVVARQLARVADLLRGGDVNGANTALRGLAQRLPLANRVGQAVQEATPVPQEPRAGRQ